MDITSLLSGGIVDAVMTVLKSTGIIKDPEQEIKIKQQIADATKNAQDFFIQYFTATIGKDEPWYSPNKLFRPICSFTAMIFYVYCRIKEIPLTTADMTLIGGIIMFWFGGRTIEKLFDKA